MDTMKIPSNVSLTLPSPRLHKLLATPDIQKMHKEFAGDRKLEPDELRELLGRYGIEFTDTQFRRFFMCINTNRDNVCSWEEFVSHLLHRFRDDETYDQEKPLDLPIEEKPKFIKSQHRYAIIRVKFCPAVLSNRQIDPADGHYITCSKDGTLITWNQDWVVQNTQKSTNPNLVVTKTWITDFCPMPDVSVLCTSSIERDLRFYDTSAGNFSPRIIINRLVNEVTCLHYSFGATDADDCRLCCGDAGGNVLLLEFNPTQRGPFQAKAGSSLRQIFWADVLTQGLHGLRATKFTAVHRDMVRQVEYSPVLNAIFSAAECRAIDYGRKAAPSLVISNLSVARRSTIMRQPKGVTCFAVSDDCSVIVTGGPDCMIRLWNHILPLKPLNVLRGHHDGITFVFLQDARNRIYSFDTARALKVWDSVEHTLLQNYTPIGTATHMDRTPFAAVYNDHRRVLILAGAQIISVRCRPRLDLTETDGYTHTRDVSVCLYNALFRTVITCGFDSMIIVWDPWTGARRSVIRHAHTRKSYGEVLCCEITAGTFDPKDQLLITGARDGTLRVWNVNAGVCVRNLSIEPMCEVTSVVWLPNRILAVGWNKHVTEFTDATEDVFGPLGKHWVTLHAEDVSCSAYCYPLSMATGSYEAELVLWKLQTGQPYKRINVNEPKRALTMAFEGGAAKLPPPPSKRTVSGRAVSVYVQPGEAMPALYKRQKSKMVSKRDSQPRRYNLSDVMLPEATKKLQKTAVNGLLFLLTREMDERRGTLLVALSTGDIQTYTHHPFAAQSFIHSFRAVHSAGDSVTAMETDAENRYLFTGTAFGFMKVWLIRNYCLLEEEKVHINMPLLRLQFPFMTHDRWMGRAKRMSKHLTNPMLVNSYRAHTLVISNVVYMNDSALLLTSSADRSARMWTLSGRYIGTFGSPVVWKPMDAHVPPEPDYPFRIPPDIQRAGSSTTLKVLMGGFVEDPLAVLAAQMAARARELENLLKPGEQARVHGKPLPESVVFKDPELPKLQPLQQQYELDMSQKNIPIYHHLRYEKSDIVKKAPKPKELIKRAAQLKASGYHTPSDSEDDLFGNPSDFKYNDDDEAQENNGVDSDDKYER